MTLSSDKVIPNFLFGGVPLDIMVNEDVALPEKIWTKVGTKFEGFDLLQRGGTKQPNQ